MASLDEILKSVQLSQNLIKSFDLGPQISEMIQVQDRMKKSFSGLNMIVEIAKSMKHQTMIANPSLVAIDAIKRSMSLQPKLIIPKSAIDAITSIGKQHEQLFGSLRSISEAIRFHQPAFSQFNNLHFALSGISGQIAAIAAQQKNWKILDDYEEVTEQALEFTETLTVELEEGKKREFQILLALVLSFLNKHKTLGVSALLIIDIFLRFAGMHQYIDFLKVKPELATKKEISQISIKQDSITHFIQLVSEQLKQVKEYRIAKRDCEVRLKPKSKTIVITKIPKDFELVVLQVQNKWVLVSFFDPKDNLPQTGWILKKNLDKP